MAPFQSASELAAEGNGDGDGWQHKDFLRGKPHLLQEIARVAIKSAEKQQQRQLPMPKNKTNCSLTSSNGFTFAFPHTIHTPQAQAQDNRNLKRIEPSLSFAPNERSRKAAKARANTVIAAAAAAGGTLPVTPYSRTSRSSAFQFLSSHMLDCADCPITRNCTPDTEQTMETEEVEVEVEGADTKGSSTDATRITRRISEEAEVSQLQLQLQDNTNNNNDDDDNDDTNTNTNNEDWEFKMKLDKIFDEEDGDDIMSSKACEDDLLSILSLDEDNKLNLVCEEEVHCSSDFDMVYNTRRCGLLEQNVNLELNS